MPEFQVRTCDHEDCMPYTFSTLRPKMSCFRTACDVVAQFMIAGYLVTGTSLPLTNATFDLTPIRIKSTLMEAITKDRLLRSPALIALYSFITGCDGHVEGFRDAYKSFSREQKRDVHIALCLASTYPYTCDETREVVLEVLEDEACKDDDLKQVRAIAVEKYQLGMAASDLIVQPVKPIVIDDPVHDSVTITSRASGRL